MKKLLLAFFAGSAIVSAHAQGNECGTAAVITQTTTLTPTVGTTAGATQSMPGCSGTANDDVWYQFVATSSVANIYALGDGDFDMVFEVFSGACGSLVSLGCVDNTYEGEEESEAFAGLTVGQTYYIRLYDYYSTPPSALTFAVAVTAPCGTLTQPAGSIAEAETCGGDANGGCLATTPVYQDITCGDVIWGSAWADGGTRDTDWYRFTVTQATSVTATLTAEFPAAVLFVNISDCAAPAVIASNVTDGCAPAALTYSFAPGTYVAFVGAAFFEGYPCGTFNEYSLALTMATTPSTLSAGGPTTFCAGGNVGLTTTGAAPYTWYNGSTAIPSATGSSYTATAAGSYTAVSNDANGCDVTSNAISVTVNPLDDASFSYASGTLCTGGSNETPTVATPGGTFSSSAGIALNTSTGEIDMATSTDGTYIVSYTTAGTCPNSSTFTVTITAAPDASFTYAQTAYCSGDADPAPVFGAGASAGTFSSTAGLTINASGQIDLSASTAGTYTVTNMIAAAGACPASTETFDVTINETPSAVVSGGGSACGAATVPVSIALTGSGPWDFSYSDGTNTTNVTGQTTSPYTIDAAASGVYTVTNVTQGSCSATGSGAATVTINPDPVVTIAAFDDVCTNGGAVTLSGAVPAGGTFSGPNVSGTTFDPAAAGAGTYTITYSYTDANGCSGSATSDITVNAAPAVTFGAIADACENHDAFALTATPAGGTFTGPGVTGGDFDPGTAGAGTHTINYTYTDANGCSGAATQTVVVDECLTIDELDGASLLIAPNPSSDEISVTYAGEAEVNGLALLTTDGKIVAAAAVSGKAFQETLDVSTLASGVYFVRLATAKGLITQKVVVR